jgi:pimeloyl-ACP methyl ester carboxylesterase
VAAQLARLLDATDDAPPPEGIAAVLLGGGPIPESLVVRAVAAGWPVVPSYGMTETASGVVAMPLGSAVERPWSAGRALPEVQLRIGLGGNTGATAAGRAVDVAATGEAGELWVRGPMLFAGYLDDAEATAARFDADGWFRTGDLCELDAGGWLRFIDRVDDVIVSGGEKVAPAEVEAALLAHPGVAEAGVIGVPDERWGRVPAAIVVPRRGWDPSDDALRDGLRQRLAPWKMPARFLRAASLPRGGGEKLLRRVLAEWVAAAPPPPTAATTPTDGTAQPGSAPSRVVLADDGQALAVRLIPGSAESEATPKVAAESEATPKVAAVLVLHATLSSSVQLVGLGAQLSDLGGVLLLDRRGSGGSTMPRPTAVSVARHVGDALATLDACGVEQAILVGHSFGAVVALELAARHPDRVKAVAAWEPPLIPLASEPDRSRLLNVADLVAAAHAVGGPAAAAEAFFGVVSGPGAWQLLRPAQRAAIGAAGDGALADAAMPDLDIDGLSAIRCPVVLATGGLSDAFYATIVEALAKRLPTTRVARVPGLRHTGPITRPDAFAALVRELAAHLAAQAAAPPSAHLAAQLPLK